MVLLLPVIFPFYSYSMLFPIIWIAISSQFSLIHVSICNLHDSDHDRLGPGSIPLLFRRFGLSATRPTLLEETFLGLMTGGRDARPIWPACLRTALGPCPGVDKSVSDRWGDRDC